MATQVGAAGATVGAADGIDWASFLRKQDPVWERLPANWWEAPFLGNGLMGTMVRQTAPQTIRFDIDRADVQEHRPVATGAAGETGGFDALWARSRLPIGYFSLATVGTITGGLLRLDLWNAELTGEIQTEKGAVRLHCLVHAEQMIVFLHIERMGGESGAKLEWNALPAVCPRDGFGTNKLPPGYAKNLEPVTGTVGDVQTCVQPLVAGGETTTAWHQTDTGNQSTLFVSVAHTFPSSDSFHIARAAVKAAQRQSVDDFVASHRGWWHKFYPASFVTLPDTYWESFYWIQLYKLASATRADRAVIDNQGPWLQPTPWPAAWWNLNVQLTYWTTLPANHPELSESLARHLEKNVANLIANVPKEYQHDSAGIGRVSGQDLRGRCGVPGSAGEAGGGQEVGNLLWAMHNYWQHCRMTADDKRLHDQCFPLLQRAVNYYLHFLKPDKNGVLHLPRTYSPEYGAGTDCTYDLALLRWGLRTLIRTADRLKSGSPERAKWQETLDKLTPYATDATGYRIAADVPFDKGHRHFSHLLHTFPLHLVNRNQPGAWEMIDKSVLHWHSMGAKEGYSFTGASLMMSAFGRGNRALEYLNGLRPFLQVSTLYKEAGPVIETPLSAAHAIQQMLLQSWVGPEEETGVLRVFPAMPDTWADASFENLRAEGGFLVSAVREKGVTRFVRLQSLAGEPCRVQPNLVGVVRVSGKRKLSLKSEGDGVYMLDLRKGEEAVLYTGDAVPSLALAPVRVTAENKPNPWGLKR